MNLSSFKNNAEKDNKLQPEVNKSASNSFARRKLNLTRKKQLVNLEDYSKDDPVKVVHELENVKNENNKIKLKFRN